MTDNNLFTAKQPDGFSHESPIRAFTDFKVSGTIAIGKGFRPSLAHLAAYLDAMATKEGWDFVQVLLPEPPAVDPTIIFRRGVPAIQRLNLDDGTLAYRLPAAHIRSAIQNDTVPVARKLAKMPALGEPYVGKMSDDEAFHGFYDDLREDDKPAATEVTSDPINPAHYAGTACAEIGERLSANAYQTLKYVWRLGRKDEPCQEIGKSIWYWKREINLIGYAPMVRFAPDLHGIKNPASFLQLRISDQSEFTQLVAGALWAGYGKDGAQHILEMLETQQKIMECGRGLAI